MDKIGDVIISVEKTNGCSVHKVGESWRIVQGKMETRDKLGSELCPLAISAVYPTIYALRYDTKLPWLKEGDRSVYTLACCPHEEGRIVFKIERITK